jgi:ankyrin repeat protein
MIVAAGLISCAASSMNGMDEHSMKRAKMDSESDLCALVTSGSIDKIGQAIDAGADVNAEDEDGDTPLICAAEEGHAEVCRLLIKSLLLQPVIRGRILSEAYKQVRLALLALKNTICPKNLYPRILCSNSALEKDLLWVLVDAQERGKKLGNFSSTIGARLLPLVQEEIDAAKSSMLEAHQRACNDETKELLNPETLDERRIEEILGIPKG